MTIVMNAKKHPDLNLPPGNETCEVSIVDSSCLMTLHPSTLVEPDIDGYEWLNLPDYAFYIKHTRTGAEVMFDLGTRKDWQNLVPHVVESIQGSPGMRVDEEVVDILQQGGIDPQGLQAVILSHWHFDHVGNLARLNPRTDLIVGPGFKQAFEPGYPANPTSPFHEADFAGRNVIEAPFDSGLTIGEFQAYDFFKDGSLYVLNVPGHTTGHISALVRTTPETFVFLGGDVCHFPGVVRPSRFIPMPDEIPRETMLDARLPLPCPCSLFTACHRDPEQARTRPFFDCASGKGPYGSWYDDPKTAMESITRLIAFDADPNVLLLIAHDLAPRECLTMFPNGTINDWKARERKTAIHWHFVNELPVGGRQQRHPLIDGLYRDDGQGVKRVKTLSGDDV